MSFSKVFPILLSAIFFLASTSVRGQDECTHLFFTPAWQNCFMTRLQNSIQAATVLPNFYAGPVPAFNPMSFQDGSSFSSSSSTGMNSFGSTSTSVLSSNGRTWRVESAGLPMSASSTDASQHVKVYIGNPTSVVTSRDDAENRLRVDVEYADGSAKWVGVKLDSPTRVADLIVTRNGEMLYIDGHM